MRLEQQSARISSGKAVHHPHHGIGQVQSIREHSFDGANGTIFAQLYFKREGLTLILPMQAAEEAVRSPITRRQARQILDYIENWDGRPSRQWKARASAHQEAIARGDPFGYAEVFKGLCVLESEGSLRQLDRTHFKQAMDFLADELSFALGETLDQARKLLMKAAAER